MKYMLTRRDWQNEWPCIAFTGSQRTQLWLERACQNRAAGEASLALSFIHTHTLTPTLRTFQVQIKRKPLEDVPYFESLGQSSSPHPCSCLVMYCDVFSQQIGGVMPVHNNAVGLQVSLWHGTCLCMACVSFTPLTIISPVYYHIRFLAIAKLFKWLLIHKAACILCHMHCFANYPAISCHLLAPCQVKATFACFFLLINLHWRWRLINVGEKLSWWLEGPSVTVS